MPTPEQRAIERLRTRVRELEAKVDLLMKAVVPNVQQIKDRAHAKQNGKGRDARRV